MRRLLVLGAALLCGCSSLEGLGPTTGGAGGQGGASGTGGAGGTWVEGTLLSHDGTLAAQARVALLDEQRRAVVVSVAGDDGRFRLQAPAGGTWRYAAVALDGPAALGQWTLQPGGTNDEGQVFLLPRGEVPDLVEVRGLGVEEQHSSVPGGLVALLGMLDGTTLAQASDRVLLLEADGGEEVVARDLAPGPGYAGEYLDTRGLDCGWAAAWAVGEGTPTGETAGLVVYDLERRRELWRGALRWVSRGVPDDALLQAATCTRDGAWLLISNLRGSGEETLLGFRRGADAPEEHQLVFTACAPGDICYTYLYPGGLVANSTFGQARTDLFTGGASRTIVAPSTLMGAFEGRAMISWGDSPSDAGIALVDIADGGTRQLDLGPIPTGILFIDYDQLRGVLWAMGVAGRPWPGLSRLDLASGIWTSIEPTGAAADMVRWCAGLRDTSLRPCWGQLPLLLGPGRAANLLTGDGWSFPWPSGAPGSLGPDVTSRWSPEGTLWLTFEDRDAPQSWLVSARPGQPARRRTFHPGFAHVGFLDRTGMWYLGTDPRTSERQLFFLSHDAP